MRILLEHDVPQQLRHQLQDHEVHTAQYRGWNRLQNGRLQQAAAEDGYDLFITCDQGIATEEDLDLYDITLVTIMSGQWPHIRQNVDLIRAALPTARRARRTGYG